MISTAGQSEAFHCSMKNTLTANNETAFDGNGTDSSSLSIATLGPQQQWLFPPLCSTALSALFSCNSTLTNFDHLKGNAFTVPITPFPVLPTLKEVIKFRSCTLYPPKASAIKATTRERPPGCRTIFIGGIPDNATEVILREVFGIFGIVTAIRMSKKNFCHIRYENEDSVDKAMNFSGYRMKINEQEDSANTGRLHVDFAQARDDQHEYECKQRALQREMRHRESGGTAVSSFTDFRYSEHETATLIEKLKSEDSFIESVRTLICWLEKGECRKKNCSQFYSALQTISNQMRRLQNEGNDFELEMQKAKQLYVSRMQSLLMQFNLMQEVFEVVSQQKVWDHFTKAQRKNISVWKQQLQRIKHVHIEDIVNKRQEDEMDLSDDDSNESISGKRKLSIENIESSVPSKRINFDGEIGLSSDSNSEINASETDSVSNILVTQEACEATEIQILQKTVQGLEYQLLMLRKQMLADGEERQRLKSLLDEQQGEQLKPTNLSSIGVRILSLVSIYLSIHPSGASLDGICDYINSQTHIKQEVDVSTIETILQSFPDLFTKSQQESKENYWQYNGFNSN